MTRSAVVLAGAACISLGFPTVSRGDLGPPIKVRLPKPHPGPAVSGVEYAGAFEVVAGQAGTIESLVLRGEGWAVRSIDFPGRLAVGEGEILRVAFRAVPIDATKPLTVSLQFEGWSLERHLDLSRANFERRGRPSSLIQFSPGRQGAAPTKRSAGDALRIKARFVYTRAGLDNDGNGFFTDPGDVPPTVLGADGVAFEIWDDDSPDPFDEMMFEGVTGADGSIDVTFDWDDCDVLGCDDPDIYLRFITNTTVVNVKDADDDMYTFSTDDNILEDFEGSEHDFGTLTPGDPNKHPPLHIHTSMVKTHRYILAFTGIGVQEVGVVWPADSGGASYSPGLRQINVGNSRTWREDTHSHEYGHHFMELHSVNTAPDYCNMICDCEPMACGSPSGCGHCMWCDETDHDAWNEGWPNWLADVVTRSYQPGYGYMPVYFRDQENITPTCDRSGFPSFNNNPLTTEGYAGALLRDIEDPGQDDHDNLDYDGDGNPDDYDGDGTDANDCGVDSLGLGVEGIFTVVIEDKPRTPVEFITRFRERYPEFDQDLWSTVRNVATEFGFPVPTPIVTSQTTGCQSYQTGEILSLSAYGNGSRLRYQWRRDGANLADGGSITGATTPILTINPLATGDGGVYTCMVSTCDQTLSVISQPIRVTVFPDPSAGRLPFSWGLNTGGQLGQGTMTNPDFAPAKQVVGVPDAVAISGGYQHFLAVRLDGTVMAWGANSYGELGNGSFGGNIATPVAVNDLEDVVGVAAGTDHSMALKADGTVWTWGSSFAGVLGDPNAFTRAVPGRVPNVECVVAIEATPYTSIALKSDGTVWAWGLILQRRFARLNRCPAVHRRRDPYSGNWGLRRDAAVLGRSRRSATTEET